MGLRGPGAKKGGLRGRVQDAGSVAEHGPFPWEAENLSRFEKVCAFLESLPVTSGLLAGTTMKLLPFQKAFLRKVYRTDRKGRRIVRQAVLSVPRKQGKTGLSAGLCLCHLLGPEAESRGQLYSAANEKSQAALLYDEMCAIIEAVPWMAERVNVKSHIKEVHDLINGSSYKAISTKASSKMGFSASFVVYDEYGQATSRELYDALYTSMGARKEPLMLTISTQAATDAMPLSRLIDYGLKVQSGLVKDPSFAMEFLAAPADADIFSPAVWKACNPALGKFLSLEDMKSQAKMAREMPSLEPAFRNLRLNQRCEQTARFIPARLWDACAGRVEDAELAGPCFGGLDLSTTTDLSAFVLWWPECGAVRVWCWLPEIGLAERAHGDGVPYPEWVRSGALLTTTGKTIDRRAIAATVIEACDRWKPRAIAFDRWRYKELERVLADDFGIDAKRDMHFVEWGQGFKDMAPAVDAFEKNLIDGSFRHGGQPVLRWCASNAVVETDPAGNRKLTKQRSTGRIDALIALVMACGVAATSLELERTVSADEANSMIVTW